MFWPVIEQAAERIHGLYRVFITQEFIVGSSRILPGEARMEVGAYEAPHWAEQDETSTSAGQSSRDESVEGKHTRENSVEGRHTQEKAGSPTMSEMRLPQWPNSAPGSQLASSESSTRSLEV